MESIEKKLNQLPPELRKEAIDFIDFLLTKKVKKKDERKPKLNWAGALKEFRDKFTSVELQHKISEWRIKDELDRY